MKLLDKRPYRTGFCGTTMPDSSHARCPKTVAGSTCSCSCHAETGDPDCCSAEAHDLGVHQPGHSPAN